MHGSLLKNRNIQHDLLPLAYEFIYASGTVHTIEVAKRIGCSTDTVTEVCNMFRQVAAYVLTEQGEGAHIKTGGPSKAAKVVDQVYRRLLKRTRSGRSMTLSSSSCSTSPSGSRQGSLTPPPRSDWILCVFPCQVHVVSIKPQIESKHRTILFFLFCLPSFL